MRESSYSLKVGTHVVHISNSEKVLFPSSGITKGDLVRYYHRIAPVMLPYMKNRLVTMHRFPDGITKEGFYQKDAQDYFPSYIAVQPVEKGGDGIVRYVVATNRATIVYLANLACITPHLWLSRVDRLKYPDRMIFDFDPAPSTTFTDIRWVAYHMKELLEQLGLKPFVMTTGSRGVHIAVPIKRLNTFDEVRAIAGMMARLLVQRYPKKLTLEIRKAKRGKRIFVDILRNSWGATAVAPYAVRALPGAPIATPISWTELSTVTPQRYTLKNIFQRIARVADPWKTIRVSARSLGPIQKKLARMLRDTSRNRMATDKEMI